MNIPWKFLGFMLLCLFVLALLGACAGQDDYWQRATPVVKRTINR